jgi:hypothetical protein
VARRCPRCGAAMSWVLGSLHRPLNANALAAFPADERFDDSEAAKQGGRSAVRAAGAANLVGSRPEPWSKSYHLVIGHSACDHQAQLVLSPQSAGLRPAAFRQARGKSLFRGDRHSSRGLPRVPAFVISGESYQVKSLHRPLDADALAALPADERFDDAEAGGGVHASAMRTAGAANLHGCELHQSGADAVDGNRIDHGAARVAHEVCHVAGSSTTRQPSQSAPVASSCGMVR